MAGDLLEFPTGLAAYDLHHMLWSDLGVEFRHKRWACRGRYILIWPAGLLCVNGLLELCECGGRVWCIYCGSLTGVALTLCEINFLQNVCDRYRGGMHVCSYTYCCLILTVAILAVALYLPLLYTYCCLHSPVAMVNRCTWTWVTLILSCTIVFCRLYVRTASFSDLMKFD